MKKKHCPDCGRLMQRWGQTGTGKPRFFCTLCRKTATWSRKDTSQRHLLHELYGWLGGKESLKEIAREAHKTRQALWKEFHPLFNSISEPLILRGTKLRILIVDGTYVHTHLLCALIAIDEMDRIFWRFAPYESYAVWTDFLSAFGEPEIIVMDGQKGLSLAARTLWPRVPIQRCQFHLIAFVTNYVGRRPSEQIGKDLLEILYSLKEAKTPAGRDDWLRAYHAWERDYEHWISARDKYGRFIRPRLRSARLIIRRALPYLFTFLNHPGAPNTTNLVEGWINGAIAEALRLHRGLRIHEKKMLVAIILSKLKRPKAL